MSTLYIDRLALRFSEREIPLDDYEEDSYVSCYSADILGYGEADDEATKLGHIRFRVVRISQALERMSLFEAIDSVDQTLYDIGEALFDLETGSFRERVERLADYPLGMDLLLFDELAVHAAYRGYGIGLLAKRSVMIEFGSGCGLAVGKAFPLQFCETTMRGDNESLRFSSLPRNENAAKKRLRAHYAKLGFKRLGRTDIVLFNMGCAIPKLEWNGAEIELAAYGARPE